jgi:hypothetical protein
MFIVCIASRPRRQVRRRRRADHLTWPTCSEILDVSYDLPPDRPYGFDAGPGYMRRNDHIGMIEHRN